MNHVYISHDSKICNTHLHDRSIATANLDINVADLQRAARSTCISEALAS
jgi:hypothetical protein